MMEMFTNKSACICELHFMLVQYKPIFPLQIKGSLPPMVILLANPTRHRMETNGRTAIPVVQTQDGAGLH
jgi:hypothetical protein